MALPAPIAAPRTLPGERHAPDHTFAELDALGALREGDQFTWRGDHYIATADASDVIRDGFRRVFVQACSRNPAMRSGWQLADVTASRRVSSLEDIAEVTSAPPVRLRQTRTADGASLLVPVEAAPEVTSAPVRRPTLPKAVRRLLARGYRDAHAGRGYGKGAHGRINERAHILELIGDKAEGGLVAIYWTGTTYCDAPGGIATSSESVIPVPSLACPDDFWRLIDSSDPGIEGPCGWRARKPSQAGKYAARIDPIRSRWRLVANTTRAAYWHKAGAGYLALHADSDAPRRSFDAGYTRLDALMRLKGEQESTIARTCDPRTGAHKESI